MNSGSAIRGSRALMSAAAKASTTKSGGVDASVTKQIKTASILKSLAFCKFLGVPEPESSRSNVVKKMWEYIKRNKLQDFVKTSQASIIRKQKYKG
ncbi:hypothetical protein FRX31_026245 [Thalictrum thalictroides]|uniref:DM2 domain-containing protein n=1 Tax=Thalictrum thalictroides TaxID=46969 RepID=A0A7J6VHE9_THATH|nr:hypothetical protein FRX31_026245 [Thalictrum thalictroides]